MKIKALNTIWTPKRFFLMMIVPLLIGVFIALSTPVLAQWESESDEKLTQNPKLQGWSQVNDPIKAVED